MATTPKQQQLPPRKRAVWGMLGASVQLAAAAIVALWTDHHVVAGLDFYDWVAFILIIVFAVFISGSLALADEDERKVKNIVAAGMSVGGLLVGVGGSAGFAHRTSTVSDYRFQNRTNFKEASPPQANPIDRLAFKMERIEPLCVPLGSTFAEAFGFRPTLDRYWIAYPPPLTDATQAEKLARNSGPKVDVAVFQLEHRFVLVASWNAPRFGDIVGKLQSVNSNPSPTGNPAVAITLDDLIRSMGGDPDKVPSCPERKYGQPDSYDFRG